MTDDQAIELWKLLAQYVEDGKGDDPQISGYTIEDVQVDIEQSLGRERLTELRIRMTS